MNRAFRARRHRRRHCATRTSTTAGKTGKTSNTAGKTGKTSNTAG